MGQPPPFAELACTTNFSFLEGASHPEEYVERAAELGLAGIGICDRDGVSGVVRAYREAKERGLRLALGARPTLSGGLPPLRLLATSREGWGGLCQLLTSGLVTHPKGEAEIPLSAVLESARDLLCLAPWDMPDEALPDLRDAFGDRLYFLVSRRHDDRDDLRVARQVERGRRFGVPLLASNEPIHHAEERQPLQDVLTCIRARTTLDRAGTLLQANAERHLLPAARMAERFPRLRDAVARTAEALDRCAFTLGELRYAYPQELVPGGHTPESFLRACVEEGLARRWPDGPPARVRAQVEHEVAVIDRLGFARYFLTVWDIVRFARERRILCQGRGSAANSAVCYALGITAVDPDRSWLLFERFISEERGEPPDIDVDFEHERREEVIQYLYRKYGRDRAGMVCEMICYRGRLALREVGKAFGLSADEVDRLSKEFVHSGVKEVGDDLVRRAGLDPGSETVRHVLRLARELAGFPRHLSIHVGGFCLTDTRLTTYVPVENAAMPDRTIIQWDKDDIDAVGMLKVDVLGLGMLTAIRKAFDLVEGAGGGRLELATIPSEDPAVYDMISAADTVGVFQIESRAQMSMLPRLRPRCFYDLVVEVAIVRPGPIQGQMVHPYLRRRNGEEPVRYPHPALREILERTYGVPLFQEQVMAMAVAVAGFTPGQADQLRRMMGAWRKKGRLQAMRESFVAGMLERGVPRDFADRVYMQIEGFGEYGFPESHAASFALLVYASAWLKLYHPAAFAAALINSQPMGFYTPSTLVQDAGRHGVQTRAVDVQASGWDCSLEPLPGAGPALRLGLRLVKGLGEEAGRRVEAERARRGPFRSLGDLARRTGLSRESLGALAEADALAGLGLSRREAIWAVAGLDDSGTLFAGMERPGPRPALPPQRPLEAVKGDYRSVGLSLRSHPIALVRERLRREGVVTAREAVGEVPEGRRAKVAGLVLNRQQPHTASGVIFMTLEDETGHVNLVIWPRILARQRKEVVGCPTLVALGKVERESGAMNLVVDRLAPLDLGGEVPVRSRDFR
ncbi:error-prone DNA polymerase [Myxococcota bacterium]|nr:error-prone DNA polymerase [Myxococcota bacterium]